MSHDILSLGTLGIATGHRSITASSVMVGCVPGVRRKDEGTSTYVVGGERVGLAAFHLMKILRLLLIAKKAPFYYCRYCM